MNERATKRVRTFVGILVGLVIGLPLGWAAGNQPWNPEPDPATVEIQPAGDSCTGDPLLCELEELRGHR